jgi:hypothetical protein
MELYAHVPEVADRDAAAALDAAFAASVDPDEPANEAAATE